MPTEAIWTASSGRSACELSFDKGRLSADLDAELGGQHPSPHEILDGALAACTALTLELYAKRRNIPLARVEVVVVHEKGSDALVMRRTISMHGALDDAQRASLLRVAEACPIHKALTGRIEIVTTVN